MTPPEYYNFAVDVVDKQAAQDVSRLALMHVSSGGTVSRHTFADIAKASIVAATALKEAGVRRGDVVIMVLPRWAEWWIVFTALSRLGAIPAPCTTLLVGKDLLYRVRKARATHIFADHDALSKLERAIAADPEASTLSNLKRICIRDPEDMSADASQHGHGRLDYSTLISAAAARSASFKGVQTRASDPALLYFTSGTTGNPKAVLHSQVSYALGHSLTGKHWLDLCPGKIYWNMSEQGWAKAGWSVCGAWTNGAALFVQDLRGPFSVSDTLKTLHTYPITTLCAAPTVYRQLCTATALTQLASLPPKALVHCCGAGEPLNASVIDLWRKATGLTIRDAFGQTETICVCANSTNVTVRPGSMGQAMPGITLAVIDADGNELPPDGVSEGDLAIVTSETDRATGVTTQSDHFIFLGYWDPSTDSLQRPTRTTPSIPPSTIIPDPTHPPPQPLTPDPQQSWSSRSYYPTGDRATLDQQGYLWFVGRDDDVINSAGYRIGPFEVESALREHAAVVESAAVGSPDRERDLVVKAFIVVTPAVWHSLLSSPSTTTTLLQPAPKPRSQALIAAEAEADLSDFKAIHNVLDQAKLKALTQELQAHVKRTAAPYKYPREIEIVQRLPKTVSGKIRRNVLRQLEKLRKSESMSLSAKL
ncbi:hypothetical protein PYCC9005_004677 [Savitreella phatthalungensis]